MCFFIAILPLLYFHEHVKFHNKYMGNITDGLTGCPAQGKNKLGETIFLHRLYINRLYIGGGRVVLYPENLNKNYH